MLKNIHSDREKYCNVPAYILKLSKSFLYSRLTNEANNNDLHTSTENYNAYTYTPRKHPSTGFSIKSSS